MQPKFEALAKERLAALEAADPALAGGSTSWRRPHRPGLGLAEGTRLAAEVTEIWHLAAVYDLGVPRDVGMRVNVKGTRHVLRFAEGCPGLRRHHYVSTCYVSGRHCGPFHETDLDVGQAFNNFYEETKFLAEVQVAEARDGGCRPRSTGRPSSSATRARATPRSSTGPTSCCSGCSASPRRFALVPLVGDPTMVRFNMVPSDFVIDAIEHLSGLEASAGRTYQLADPRPLTVDELLTEMCRATGRRGVRVPLPRRLTTWALAHVEPLARYVGIPADAVEYFVHPTHYDTAQTDADLAGSGVACPAVARLPAQPGAVHGRAPRREPRRHGLNRRTPRPLRGLGLRARP